MTTKPMKHRHWDLSQLSGDEMDDLQRIFRHQHSRLIPSDGLDDDNLALNGIRPDLYEDLSHPFPTAPEIPAEYRVKQANQATKNAALVGLTSAMVGLIWEVISHSFTGILVYLTIAIGIVLLAVLAWR